MKDRYNWPVLSWGGQHPRMLPAHEVQCCITTHMQERNLPSSLKCGYEPWPEAGTQLKGLDQHCALQWQPLTLCRVLHTCALKHLSLCNSISAGLLHAQEGDGEHDPIHNSPWDTHWHLPTPAAASHSGSLGCSQHPVVAPRGQASMPVSGSLCAAYAADLTRGRGQELRGNLLGTGLRCHPKQSRERAMPPLHTGGV